MGDSEAITRPIIIDLGKTKRKRIRRLKRGYGLLAAEVQEVVDDLKQQLGDAAADKEFVPVIIIYRRKRKKRNKSSFPFRLVNC